MKKMTSEEKQKIVNTLSAKGATHPCPRCGQKNFTLLDGYFNQSINQELSTNIAIGGSSVPSIAVVCNNCGYMSQHALGILGLLSNEGEKHGPR